MPGCRNLGWQPRDVTVLAEFGIEDHDQLEVAFRMDGCNVFTILISPTVRLIRMVTQTLKRP